MKPKCIQLLCVLFLVSVITACSGSAGPAGNQIAGVGGSGYISSGQITGFGSVYVNGVKFNTDSATFNVENTLSSQQALRIGMIVQVAGVVNADGVTGTATAIRYGDNLQGFIEALPGENSIINNAADTEKRFSVMGINVIVDAVNTTFEGDGFDYAHMSLGHVVELSGYYDNNGVLRASYIELKSDQYTTESIVEIEGRISNLMGNHFHIRGVDINFSTGQGSAFMSGLRNGLYVELKGTYNANSNMIFAEEVNGVDISLVESSEVSLEGYITRYASDSDFDINGYNVDASAAVLSPSELVLRAGLKINVEGVINNGQLKASKIIFYEGNAKINAYIDSIDLLNNQFTIEVLTGEPSVLVQLTQITLIENAVATTEPISLSDLAPGDFVDVSGYETATGTVSAVIVRRRSPGSIKLQGVLSAQTENVSISLLGVEYPVSAGSTEYESENEDYDNHGDFINATVISESIISIEDEPGNGTGVADEVSVKKT